MIKQNALNLFTKVGISSRTLEFTEYAIALHSEPVINDNFVYFWKHSFFLVSNYIPNEKAIKYCQEDTKESTTYSPASLGPNTIPWHNTSSHPTSNHCCTILFHPIKVHLIIKSYRLTIQNNYFCIFLA